MSLRELIFLAFSALKNNLMRTLLTMLGIVIGVGSVIIIISIGNGATASITNQISSFGTNLIIIAPGAQNLAQRAASRQDTLTIADATSLTNKNKINNILAVAPDLLQTETVAANDQSGFYSITGTTAAYFSVNQLEIDQGSFFTDDDNTSLSRVAVLGAQVATDLFGEGSAVIGKTITINNKTFHVVGVTKPKGSSGFSSPDTGVFIPLETGSKLVFGRDYLSILFVQTVDANLNGQTEADITQLILDNHKITDPTKADFHLATSKDAISALSTVTGLLTLMLAGIAGISLVVGGIGIMNIMLVTVTERTKEIGLLKSIGAKKRDILRQFLIEALVLTIAGGLVGIIVGVSLSYIAAFLIKIPFIINFSAVAIAVGVSSLVGIIFGYYPAQRAAKLNPIDALRYE